MKSDERQASQPLISGFSQRTQHIDALGKVRHVFVLNQTSQRDMKSSGERVANASKRSKDAAKRRRRRHKRPSSSRLNKRSPGFNLDFVNAKASNGEDIATVRGGSTSRNNQHSVRDLGGINRLGSDQKDNLAGVNPASLPNLHRRYIKQLNSETIRSLPAKLDSSEPRSRDHEKLID